MGKIKVAQIGTGHDHASQVMVCMKMYPDLFEIVGITEPDSKRRAALGKDNSYQDIPVFDTVEELLSIPGLQGVTVETDELSACKYAMLCIRRGLPVHVDKPGGYDLMEFMQCMSMARNRGVPVHLGYMYRYHPLFRRALAMKQKGEFGEIFSVEAQMSVRHDKEKREWLSQFQGGMMYFLGCHLIDLIMQLQGEPLDIQPFIACTGAEGEKNCPDFAMAVLHYPRGYSFAKTCAMEYNGFDRRQLVITGTKGTMEIKPMEIEAPALIPGMRYTRMSTKARITLNDQEKNPWHDNSQLIETGYYGRFDEMMLEFASIVQGTRNPYSYDYETRLFLNVLKACGRK